MKKLIDTQIKGIRFEMFMEKFLKNQGYFGVERNVIYYGRNNSKRQIDLEYNKIFSFCETFVILELKYSSNGNIPLNIDNRKKEKQGLKRKIDNLITEVEEKRCFVKADKAILATNRYFENRVYDEAKRYDIEVWDRDYLQEKLNKKRYFRKHIDIEKIIANISIGDIKNYGFNFVNKYV